MPLDDEAELCLALTDLIQLKLKPRKNLIHVPGQREEEDFILAGKIMIHTPLTHFGGSGNVLHTRFNVAFGVE
jgi:hypothetical protein